MKAVVIRTTGNTDVLLYEEAPKPIPKPNEALVRLEAIGVNYIDIYHRTGLYKVPLPFIPGMEAAGVVEAIGKEVKEVSVGDRVAYAMTLGAYAEYAAVPSLRLVQLPEAISYSVAAAIMLQGMTAHYLLRSTYPVKKENTILVHAAAGGVGLLLIQIAKQIGARIIGTVSTDVKADAARNAGADKVIVYTREDFEKEVKDYTAGRGVDVVYDSVGKDTFEKSLNVLKPRGMLALFGQSSGPVPPFDLGQLSAKGSLFLTRPTLSHHINERTELLWRANELFSLISDGTVKVKIDSVIKLAEVRKAHELLEARKTIGKLLLQP